MRYYYLTETNNGDNKMTHFTTQLLTDETKQSVGQFDNVVEFANREEEIYLNAMTNAVTDFDRRKELIEAFNDSVCSYAYYNGVA